MSWHGAAIGHSMKSTVRAGVRLIIMTAGFAVLHVGGASALPGTGRAEIKTDAIDPRIEAPLLRVVFCADGRPCQDDGPSAYAAPAARGPEWRPDRGAYAPRAGAARRRLRRGTLSAPCLCRTPATTSSGIWRAGLGTMVRRAMLVSAPDGRAIAAGAATIIVSAYTSFPRVSWAATGVAAWLAAPAADLPGMRRIYAKIPAAYRTAPPTGLAARLQPPLIVFIASSFGFLFSRIRMTDTAASLKENR